jgi:hypothetical protein
MVIAKATTGMMTTAVVPRVARVIPTARLRALQTPKK